MCPRPGALVAVILWSAEYEPSSRSWKGLETLTRGGLAAAAVHVCRILGMVFLCCAGAWWEVANSNTPPVLQPYADKAGDAAVEVCCTQVTPTCFSFFCVLVHSVLGCRLPPRREALSCSVTWSSLRPGKHRPHWVHGRWPRSPAPVTMEQQSFLMTAAGGTHRPLEPKLKTHQIFPRSNRRPR